MDVNSELRDAQLEVRTTDPAHSTSKSGLVWFDWATDLVKVMYKNTIETLTTKTYVDSEVNTVQTDLDNYKTSIEDDGIIFDERGNPADTGANRVHLYAFTDGSLRYKQNTNVRILATTVDQETASAVGSNILWASKNDYGANTTVNSISSDTAKAMIVDISGEIYNSAGGFDFQIYVNGVLEQSYSGLADGPFRAMLKHIPTTNGTQLIEVDWRDGGMRTVAYTIWDHVR